MKRLFLVPSLALLVSCGQMHESSNLKNDSAGDATADFGWDLYSKINESTPKENNVFYSPVSISTALSMLYAGADGETAKEMSKALHFGPSQEATAKTFGELSKKLQASNEKDGYKLTVANKMWGKENLEFVDSYLETLKKYFASDIESIDFTQVEAAMKNINGWAAKETNNKITQVVDKDFFKGELLLVLANAVYFKGSWETEFKKDSTEEKPFKTASGKTVKSELMHRLGDIPYTEDDEVQIVKLPYKGDKIVMTVILPKEGVDLAKVEAKLSRKYLSEVGERAFVSEVNVFLPKFKVETGYELEKLLPKMGMNQAFTNAADFGGIRADRDLKVSKVVHKAFVDVNEEGTEAAAVTVIGGVRTTAVPRPPKEFRADRPFVYVIETTDGTPLFVGRLSNPQAKN